MRFLHLRVTDYVHTAWPDDAVHVQAQPDVRVASVAVDKVLKANLCGWGVNGFVHCRHRCAQASSLLPDVRSGPAYRR